MAFMVQFRSFVLPFLFPCALFGQTLPQVIGLEVPEGTPLRLYVTRRVPYRLGAPVSARFAESVWAFDRIVIPAGSAAEGHVASLEPVPGMERAYAIVRGDFTPLKEASVVFERIILADGSSLSIAAESSLGLPGIYVPPKAGKNGSSPKASAPASSRSAQIRAFARQQAQTQINTRTHGFLDFVRGPNKREWLEDFAWDKSPYHPQRYRLGTRFDSVLTQPLSFGEATLQSTDLADYGSPPAPEQSAAVRFLSTISSADAKPGNPVSGVLSAPVFTSDHHLALPAGTRLTGKVTLTRPARWFHRGGQLRFTFEKVAPPAIKLAQAPEQLAQTQLTAVEQQANPVAIDDEGTAKATESKTRLIRPVIAALVAAKSLDNDAGRQGASGGASSNYSGRSLGGFSGFGLLGTAASFGPRPIGAALGFYGLAFSAYSAIVSRGNDVVFAKNTAVTIRFSPPRSR